MANLRHHGLFLHDIAVVDVPTLAQADDRDVVHHAQKDLIALADGILDQSQFVLGKRLMHPPPLANNLSR